MSGEKKHWRLSTPFRRFSGTQDPHLKAKVGRSGSRVSSVYLPDDSSTSGFVIVPEFDYPVQTQTTHTNSNHNSHPEANLPPATSSSPSSPSVDNYPINLAPIGSQYSQYSYLGGASGDTPVVNASQDDDFTRRLGLAYQHIRSMPSAASPKVLLSSDPQMLRKQLGVPQHSVFNHPLHSSPDLPNPHASPHDPTSPGSPLITSSDMSYARISKLGLSINMDTNVYPPPPNSKIAQCNETNSRPTSGSTEVLASLAWIGAPYTANRRCHPASQAFFPDYFSMEIAVEDENISDDVLVDQLEKVRRRDEPCKRGRDVSPSRSSNNARFCNTGGCPPSSPRTSYQLVKLRDVPLHSPPISKDTTPDSEDAAVWQAVRKAFLCVREIVRTEKRYQEALKMLLNAQTATPPPPSMAPYVSALVRVSEMLLKCFIEDPSAWGVSTAFVTSEDELEASMVSWCAVAGAFFTDGDPRSSSSTGRWRLRRSGVMSSPSSSVTKRTSIPSSPQLPPLFSMTSTVSKSKERMADEYCAGQHPHTDQTTAMSLQKLESTNSQSLTGQPPSRKLSVRDLAIQPIQRVMRYVLLYRDLLDCTPATSPPRLLVERALEAATRIANHCDSAQRNPAFCHAS